jgi:Rrf2 family cysteine metabolism transcriptional repressor
MKLSTRQRYGTRAMLDIALHCPEGPVHLKDVARRQEVSKKYLEHITSRLQAAGLLRSIRGTRASTNLGRPASEIKLSEIYRTLEGPFAVLECIDNPERCPRFRTCATRDIWIRLSDAVCALLESITLEDLCRQQRAKEQPGPAMYYI